ncbi:MAG: CoA transferase [Chloroflexi bacterium]|nr:MAG: CoA transferase [Chloroflexota bacterium]
MPAPSTIPPLHGVRVVEIGGGVAAPFCTRLLTDLGADVVKVERPGVGDPSRRVGPFCGGAPDRDASALFVSLNAGKRSIELDLRSPGGRRALAQLLDRSAVVVSGLRPTSAERLGVDDSWLGGGRPKLVRVAVTSFGLSGPLRDAPASELALCCAGGLAYITGRHDDPPTKAALNQCQYLGGAHAAAGALAALWCAETSGRGQLVEVSIQEVVASILQGKFSYYTYMGCIARRQPRHSGSLQYSLMPCADGWIAPMFVPGANVDWELFAGFLGLPGLLDERFATRVGRVEHAEELERIISARLRQRTKYEWFHDAQEWRLTFGVVQTPEELLACPHLAARGFWRSVEHPAAGPMRMCGPLHRGEWMDSLVIRDPPRLGEHTVELMDEMSLDGDALRIDAAPGAGSNGTTSESAVDVDTSPLPAFIAPAPRDDPAHRLPAPGGALEGVRVVEWGEAYAVPYLGRLLADMGADVIKVESCHRPDVVRVWPFPDGVPGEQFWNRGGVFNEPNRNKRDVTLDLRDPRGLDLFKRLVSTADVLCENYTPRVASQLGLDYPALREVRPDLIMISVTGYGHSGPWHHYTAWGFTVEPTAGICNFVGYPDGPPLRTGIAYADMPAATVGAALVLAALRRRRLQGEGEWIDLSMYEVGATFIGEALTAAASGTIPPSRIGNRDPAMAPQGVYRCAGEDRWVGLTVPDDARFTALCRLMGREDLAAADRYRDAQARRDHHDELDALISAWTMVRSAEETVEALRSGGIAASMAMTVRDLLFDRHLRQRGFFELATHHPNAGDLGTRPYPGMTIRLHGTPGRIRRASPLLGEDNDEVLGELGVGATELRALEGDGIVGRWPNPARLGSVDQHVVPLEALAAAGLISGRDPDFQERLGLTDVKSERRRGA